MTMSTWNCLLTISGLFAICAAQLGLKSGNFLPGNGNVDASRYLPHWEITYHAVDYLPVCGESVESEGTGYWSNSPECERAMRTFNTTSGLQVGTYNTNGDKVDGDFGNGSQMCLCFAVKHTPSVDDVTIDICLLVGQKGEFMLRDQLISPLDTATVAVGVQSPENDDSKALPNCKDVDLSKIESEASSPTGSRSGTKSSGGEQNSEPAKGGGGGLTTEAKIALGTGIPGGILAIATMLVWCCKRFKKSGPNLTAAQYPQYPQYNPAHYQPTYQTQPYQTRQY